MPTLTLETVTLEVVSSQLPTQTGLESPSGVVNNFSIGSKIAIIQNYSYTDMADGVDFYYDPWLFDVACNYATKYPTGTIDGPPAVGYYFTLNGEPTATLFDMVINGAGLAANSQRNSRVQFSHIATGFTIRHDIILTADLEEIITSDVLANHDRLTKSSVLSPAEFQNIVQSVYNTNKSFCSLVYLVDNNNTEADPSGGSAVVTVERFHEYGLPFTARFYDKGLYNTDGEMKAESLVLSRSGATVSDFSILDKTKVNFTAKFTGGVVSGATVYLIRTDTTDNNLNFLRNYEASIADTITDIPTETVISTFGTNLKSPSLAPFLAGPDLYECSFHVDADLDKDGTYRLLIVYYDSSAGVFPDGFANTFVSEEFSVTTKPTACLNPKNVHKLGDIVSEDSTLEVAEVAPQDRIVSSGTLDLSTISSSLDDIYFAQGATPPANYLDKIAVVAVQLFERILDFPSVGTNIFSLLEQGLTTRDDSSGFWLPSPEAELNGLDLNDTGVNSLSYKYVTRIRYEPSKEPLAVLTAPNDSELRHTSVGGLKSAYISALGLNQDWRGKDIILVWRFRLTLDDLIDPFTYEFNRTEKLQVKQYDNDEASPRLVGIRCLDPVTMDELTFIDPETLNGSVLVETTRDTTVGDELHIAFFDSVVFGVDNIQEEEVFAGDLETLSSSRLFDVDEKFLDTTDKAFFKVDISGLADGLYRLSAMIK